MIAIMSNIQDNLGRSDIFTHSTHEKSISLHLFRSSLISSSSVFLLFLAYKSYMCFNTFTPISQFLLGICKWYSIFNFDVPLLMLVDRNKIYFCALYVDRISWHLAESLIQVEFVLVCFGRCLRIFYIDNHVICK